MDLIVHLWQYLASIPAETWIRLLEGITASGVVVLALQWLKKKFNIDGKRVLVALLTGMSGLASLAGFLVTYGPTSNIAVLVPELAQIWTFIMVSAVLIHRFAVSPLYKKLEATLRDWADFKASRTPAEKPESERPVPPSFAE